MAKFARWVLRDTSYYCSWVKINWGIHSKQVDINYHRKLLWQYNFDDDERNHAIGDVPSVYYYRDRYINDFYNRN